MFTCTFYVRYLAIQGMIRTGSLALRACDERCHIIRAVIMGVSEGFWMLYTTAVHR